jgi:hypothetical protein
MLLLVLCTGEERRDCGRVGRATLSVSVLLKTQTASQFGHRALALYLTSMTVGRISLLLPPRFSWFSLFLLLFKCFLDFSDDHLLADKLNSN